MIDLFTLSVAILLGEPLPPLPTIPGRVHRIPIQTDGDPCARRWERLQRHIRRHGGTDPGDGRLRPPRGFAP
jgi:hypothetical protein